MFYKIFWPSFSILVFLFIISTSVVAQSKIITWQVSPQGPLDAGDSYEVNVFIRESDGNPCTNCFVRFKLDEAQPGDEVQPMQGYTDNNGKIYTRIASYVVVNRMLNVEVVSPSNMVLASSAVPLEYSGNPILAFMKLVVKVVGQVGSLPPLGNILAKANTQKYIGNGIREIDLDWKAPFGSRRFDIVLGIKEQANSARVVKVVSDNEATIEAPSFENIFIDVRACTVGDSCVDSNPIEILKMDAIATPSAKEPIPNYGLLDPYEKLYGKMEEEQKSIIGLPGPLKDWLEGMYKLFK